MTKENIIENFHNDIDIERNLLNFDLEENAIQEDTNKKELEKALTLKNLGFINSPTTIEGTKKLEKIKLSNQQLEGLRYYNTKYPNSKFITLERFNKIRDKYGLMYERVAYYKEAIPDSMLQQITSKRKIEQVDIPHELYRVTVNSYSRNSFKKFLKLKGKTEPIFTNEEVRESHEKYRRDVPRRWVFGESGENMVFYDELTKLGLDVHGFKGEKITDYQSLYILAPHNHFLNQHVKVFTKSFLYSFLYSFNEPLVFQHCKGGFIRILTDWEYETKEEEKEFIKSDIK